MDSDCHTPFQDISLQNQKCFQFISAMAKQIAFLGHSWVKMFRNGDATGTIPEDDLFDLNLHQVSYFWRAGGQNIHFVQQLVDNLPEIRRRILKRVGMCEAVVIILGSNDVCENPGSVQEIARNLIGAAIALHTDSHQESNLGGGWAKVWSEQLQCIKYRFPASPRCFRLAGSRGSLFAKNNSIQ